MFSGIIMFKYYWCKVPIQIQTGKCSLLPYNTRHATKDIILRQGLNLKGNSSYIVYKIAFKVGLGLFKKCDLLRWYGGRPLVKI